MRSKFDYFVIFADMRTGSNFLESCLNSFETLKCLGEAYNPSFIGYPNQTELLGMTLQQRESNPTELLGRIKDDQSHLCSFRFFHDHDPRIIDEILSDQRCGKIILKRRNIDSYVSWKIAQKTDQWKLTNVARRKESKISFDAHEFDTFVQRRAEFSNHIDRRLKTSGQTAYRLDYDDLRELEIINGLANFLGLEEQLDKLNRNLKPQNPYSLNEKVSNFEEMKSSLFALSQQTDDQAIPDYEPQRPAFVPRYIASDALNCIFLPIPGASDASMANILAQNGTKTVHSKFSQKTLRDWMVSHPKHRRFKILRHQLERAHHVFCEYILDYNSDDFAQIRRKLVNRYNVPLPDQVQNIDQDDHKKVFLAFLGFLKANLLAQRTVRSDPNFASQTNIIQGFSRFAPPDALIMQDDSERFFDAIFHASGLERESSIDLTSRHNGRLSDIYCADLEAACRGAYHKDYIALGFTDYKPMKS